MATICSPVTFDPWAVHDDDHILAEYDDFEIMDEYRLEPMAPPSMEGCEEEDPSIQTHAPTIGFHDHVVVYDIPEFNSAEFSNFFYDEDELAEFRHDAWMELCGLANHMDSDGNDTTSDNNSDDEGVQSYTADFDEVTTIPDASLSLEQSFDDEFVEEEVLEEDFEEFFVEEEVAGEEFEEVEVSAEDGSSTRLTAVEQSGSERRDELAFAPLKRIPSPHPCMMYEIPSNKSKTAETKSTTKPPSRPTSTPEPNVKTSAKRAVNTKSKKKLDDSRSEKSVAAASDNASSKSVPKPNAPIAPSSAAKRGCKKIKYVSTNRATTKSSDVPKASKSSSKKEKRKAICKRDPDYNDDTNDDVIKIDVGLSSSKKSSRTSSPKKKTPKTAAKKTKVKKDEHSSSSASGKTKTKKSTTSPKANVVAAKSKTKPPSTPTKKNKLINKVKSAQLSSKSPSTHIKGKNNSPKPKTPLIPTKTKKTSSRTSSKTGKKKAKTMDNVSASKKKRAAASSSKKTSRSVRTQVTSDDLDRYEGRKSDSVFAESSAEVHEDDSISEWSAPPSPKTRPKTHSERLSSFLSKKIVGRMGRSLYGDEDEDDEDDEASEASNQTEATASTMSMSVTSDLSSFSNSQNSWSSTESGFSTDVEMVSLSTEVGPPTVTFADFDEVYLVPRTNQKYRSSLFYSPSDIAQFRRDARSELIEQERRRREEEEEREREELEREERERKELERKERERRERKRRKAISPSAPRRRIVGSLADRIKMFSQPSAPTPQALYKRMVE